MFKQGHSLWTTLGPTPLLWLTVTLGAYLCGQAIQRLCGGAAWASPVLIGIILVVCVLMASGTRYEVYFGGAQFIHFLLGPATVVLGVPLANNLGQVRRCLTGMGLALIAGSITSLVTGVVLVKALGGSVVLAMSMAPKGVTTPIAMAVAEQVGGLPTLTATLAILGGIVAAVLGEPILRRMGISDWRAHGLAAGIAGSGVAAAQIARRDPLAAAFSALGIGLNGLLTAIIAPIVLMWLR